jgi:hypothetical protein
MKHTKVAAAADLIEDIANRIYDINVSTLLENGVWSGKSTQEIAKLDKKLWKSCAEAAKQNAMLWKHS